MDDLQKQFKRLGLFLPKGNINRPNINDFFDSGNTDNAQTAPKAIKEYMTVSYKN